MPEHADGCALILPRYRGVSRVPAYAYARVLERIDQIDQFFHLAAVTFVVPGLKHVFKREADAVAQGKIHKRRPIVQVVAAGFVKVINVVRIKIGRMLDNPAYAQAFCRQDGAPDALFIPGPVDFIARRFARNIVERMRLVKRYAQLLRERQHFFHPALPAVCG